MPAYPWIFSKGSGWKRHYGRVRNDFSWLFKEHKRGYGITMFVQGKCSSHPYGRNYSVMMRQISVTKSKIGPSFFILTSTTEL